MAVPGSGAISLGQIRQELQTANYAGGAYTAAATGLDPAENGTYGAINTCSPSYPLSANPAKMSEWYGYDHDAPCLASYYAFDDGNTQNGATQNMLWSNGKTFDQNVGSAKMNVNGHFTLNLWVKHHSQDPEFQGYIAGAYDTGGSSFGRWTLVWWGWDAENDGLPYKPFVTFGIEQYDGAGSSAGNGYVRAILNDSYNTTITDIPNGKSWGGYGTANSGSYQIGAVTGSTNDRGYTMITVIYDIDQIGSDGYAGIYWNGQRLSTGWQAASGPYTNYTSSCDGDVARDGVWDNTEFVIGGFVPNELSAGLLIDEFTIFLGDTLDSTQVDALWNNGTPISVNEMTGSLSISDFLHYNFEENGNLGQDTGAGGYSYDLADYNNPAQTSDHA